jgi:hypothetical protein
LYLGCVQVHPFVRPEAVCRLSRQPMDECNGNKAELVVT